MPLDRFVHRENLRLLRQRLADSTADTECRQIAHLIEEEELKGRLALDGRDHAC
jgi:hypothetical protein